MARYIEVRQLLLFPEAARRTPRIRRVLLPDRVSRTSLRKRKMVAMTLTNLYKERAFWGGYLSRLRERRGKSPELLEWIGEIETRCKWLERQIDRLVEAQDKPAA